MKSNWWHVSYFQLHKVTQGHYETDRPVCCPELNKTQGYIFMFKWAQHLSIYHDQLIWSLDNTHYTNRIPSCVFSWGKSSTPSCGSRTSRFCKECRSPCQAACSSCAWGGSSGLDIHLNTFPWSSGGHTSSAVCWLQSHRVISALALSSCCTTCKQQQAKQ